MSVGRLLPRSKLWLVPVLGLLIGLGVVLAAPPDAVVIETGPVGGGYYDTAVKYQAALRARGIRAILRPKADSLSIINDVAVPTSGVDIGFAAQDIARADYPGVVSLGRTEVQPLFVFCGDSLGQAGDLSQLRGHRIVMPPQRSATSEAALRVLKLFGVSEENTSVSFMPLSDAVAALAAGEFDAGLFILSADNALIRTLVHHPHLRLLANDKALAVSRMLPFLVPVTLPRGIYDIEGDIPPATLPLLGAPVDVVAKKDLHPAIAYALLEVMGEVHRGATPISGPGEFPTPNGSPLQLSGAASQYYRNGVPWIHRELPRALAGFGERNLAYVVTLLVATQIYLSSKWIYELVYFFLDQCGMLLLLWVHRSSSRSQALSNRRVRLVRAIERTLLRQTNKQRREELIAKIHSIGGEARPVAVPGAGR